jgi:hypothetical protein
MKTNGLVLIHNQIRRTTVDETAKVAQFLGGIKTFNTAVELGEVYHENPASGFFYVELAYDIPGAAIVFDDDVMLTHLLDQVQCDDLLLMLGPGTFKDAVKTGRQFSSPYMQGSVQWYPGNDDIPPAK